MKFKRKVTENRGTIRPETYDWVKEFDGLTSDEEQTWVSVNRGKLRGLVIYALNLARRRRRR